VDHKKIKRDSSGLVKITAVGTKKATMHYCRKLGIMITRDCYATIQ